MCWHKLKLANSEAKHSQREKSATSHFSDALCNSFMVVEFPALGEPKTVGGIGSSGSSQGHGQHCKQVSWEVLAPVKASEKPRYPHINLIIVGSSV